MPKYKYDKLVKFNENFVSSRSDLPPVNPDFERFSIFLWSGNDEGIWCVYRQDPRTKEILRIEFFAPKNRTKKKI